MTNGDELTYAELRARAVEVFEASGKSQSELAEELELHRSTISRALSESGAGPKFQKAQRRIIEYLTDWRIERQVLFVLREEPSGHS